MSAQVITVQDTPPQAWRNGGGQTRELLAWPSPQHWQLRLSVADIEADGPFSVFPGVQRWFVALQGAGVDLSIKGQACRVEVGDMPLCFDGADPAHCRLTKGPTRDLNLMLRGVTGALVPAMPGVAWPTRGTLCGLFASAAGQCVAQPAPPQRAERDLPPDPAAAGRWHLPAQSLLCLPAPPQALVWQPQVPASENSPTQAWWWWAALADTP